MSDEKKNVTAYTISPRGDDILIVAEQKPLKSASGEIYHAGKADEVLRKGLVIDIGPEVKRVKKGDRILYLFNSAMEVEMFYASTYGENCARKYFVKDEHVRAVIKECGVDDFTDTNAVVRCLKGADLDSARQKGLEDAQRQHSMQKPGKILRVN